MKTAMQIGILKQQQNHIVDTTEMITAEQYYNQTYNQIES